MSQTEGSSRISSWPRSAGKVDCRLGEVARGTGTLIIASLFERRSAGLYHDTTAIIDTMEDCSVNIAKCIFPTIRCSTKSFTFTPGDLGFQRGTQRAARSACCVCWDQWYPGGRAADGALRRRRDYFYPTAIGWHPSRKRNLERRNLPRGRRFSVVMRSPNGCYVAAVNRVGHEAPAGGDGIEFGAKASCAGRTAKSSRGFGGSRRVSRRRSMGSRQTTAATLARLRRSQNRCVRRH